MTATLPDPGGHLSGGGGPSSGPSLSSREVEVLVAWLLTDTKQEAGRRLFLSGSTVNTYIQRVRDKYDAAGRPARTKVHLLVRALDDGFVDIGQIRGPESVGGPSWVART